MAHQNHPVHERALAFWIGIIPVLLDRRAESRRRGRHRKTCGIEKQQREIPAPQLRPRVDLVDLVFPDARTGVEAVDKNHRDFSLLKSFYPEQADVVNMLIGPEQPAESVGLDIVVPQIRFHCRREVPCQRDAPACHPAFLLLECVQHPDPDHPSPIGPGNPAELQKHRRREVQGVARPVISLPAEGLDIFESEHHRSARAGPRSGTLKVPQVEFGDRKKTVEKGRRPLGLALCGERTQVELHAPRLRAVADPKRGFPVMERNPFLEVKQKLLGGRTGLLQGQGPNSLQVRRKRHVLEHLAGNMQGAADGNLRQLRGCASGQDEADRTPQDCDPS